MKKLIKVALGIVAILVVLLLAGVLTLPMTIGPIVKTAASVGGPKMLGAPVSVGDVKINPLAGSLTISQVKIGNPPGYSDKDAFAVEKVEIGLDLKSLRSDTILIKKMRIDAPAIVYEAKGKASNFNVMLDNIKKAADEEKTKTDKEKTPKKKVVIETFTLNNAEVSYVSNLTLGQAVGMKLPSLELNDIGKAAGGITAADATLQVVNGILGGLVKGVADISGMANSLLKNSGDTAKTTGDTLKNLGGASADAVKDAANSIKKLNPFKK